VSPEIVARFAPTPIPDDLATKIQAMLDVRAPSPGRVSNDGKRLYFNWTVTGISQLWRIDGPQRFPVQLTGGQDRTTYAGIAPDDSFVLVSRDHAGEENPGLYLQDKAGGALVEIQHKKGVRALADFITDDGRFVYFHSNDVQPNAYAIYRWERTTGKRELVFGEDGLWSVADFRADGRLLLAKDVGSNMTEYYEYDQASKKLNPLFGVREREDYQAMYGAKDGEVIVQTPKLGDFRRLFRWERGVMNPVTPDIKHDVADFVIDHARTHIFYHVNEDGFTRLHVFDAKTFKELPLPKLPPGDHVYASSNTRDGRYTIFAVNPGNAPLESFVYDWKESKLVSWQLPSAPEIDTKTFVRATLETYPARDGTPIPMLVRRPTKCLHATAPCPVIVNFHGGPEGQSMPGFDPYGQIFVDAGFVFVQPNVRGSDGYGKKWLHADDGPKRLDIITDIEDASIYIKKAWAISGVTPKVGIMGGSYGGYSTLIGMTMFAGAYDAGASSVGISNLVTFLQNTAPYRRILRASEYGDPDKDREALVKLSPITYVDKIRAPLFVAQGLSDPRVPVGEALTIERALEARHIPVELIIFPDEGHGSQKRDNRAIELGHIVSFFTKHLAGAP